MPKQHPERSTATHDEPVSRDPNPSLRANLLVLFAHGLLGQTGFRLLQAPTLLPSYIHLLTGQELAVGVARALQSLGMFLSPVVGAGLIERRPRVKPVTLVFGGLMRLQVLFLALLALFAPRPIALAGIWPVLFLWGLAAGVQRVAFNVLLGKLIPASLRGRLLGGRNLASGLTLLLVSLAAGVLLESFGFPFGYGLTFLLAFALTAIGLALLALLTEEAHPPRPHQVSAWARLREMRAMLHADANFSRYTRALLFSTAARGALPFYIVAVGAASGDAPLSGRHIAGLTMAFTLSQAIGGLAWGALGDRAGFRRVFLGALLCWMMGSSIILYSATAVSSYLVFVLVALGFSGSTLAGQVLVLEFGRPDERALRIATTSSLSEAVGAAGFLGAGLLAQATAPSWVFATSIALQLLALARLWKSQDPRHVQP